MNSSGGINTNNEFVDQVRNNTKSDLIIITEDKLENIMLKHLANLAISSGWITPLSLLLTVFIVLLTADFKEFATISKSVWQAAFIIALIIFLGWTINNSIKAFKCSKKATINFLIKEIKNNQE